ncbi:microtubule-associated tumor suppressor 1 homolog A-like [Cynoglossus semilaevis]|uniref:microtubule-associated tumor suppressor 1 homolog A-like n=1 Tax=Cynoglossus semilaevis TaxID=244447 RepID=UPI000D62AADA|nr:microtubule-associated tumor suppressor 1 homolog A-like [Cynoglossus semilaevis]
MLWSPRLSLSNFHVKLTAKGLFRNLQLLSGCRKNTVVFHAVDKNKPREAPPRPTNANSSSSSSSLVPATAGATTTAAASSVLASVGGTSGNQQRLGLNVVNPNPPVTPVLVNEVSSTGSATAGASGLGLKPRTGTRSCPKSGSRLHNVSKASAQRASGVDGTVVTAKQNQNREQAEKKNQAIGQLRRLLVQGNRKVEALATVIQHLFSEREESLKQRKELSVELQKLQEQLVASKQSCEHLQKEREEARVNLEESLRRQEEEHREALVQLEDRLKSFYQTEWDKVHQTYQEEADKCRLLMEQQVEELRMVHNQMMECVRQQYEASIEELKQIQQTDVESLQRTLAQTEVSLSERICELSAEKEALGERLQEEEERRRRILTDKNLKDSHTLYLEQELESLKVVLDMKNNQLHQKEKKLMEMEKLVETNVKLEECLKKVQQENEDFKARMDKHAALSKQLSNEQAILQQTLQKESKVNKRLSMENEELLWKLHNGDLLASPRRPSPTSPFSSPRNSASFPTAAPLSPR